eukprot:5744609-Pleurochrysis_carterae.AAC.2
MRTLGQPRLRVHPRKRQNPQRALSQKRLSSATCGRSNPKLVLPAPHPLGMRSNRWFPFFLSWGATPQAEGSVDLERQFELELEEGLRQRRSLEEQLAQVKGQEG